MKGDSFNGVRCGNPGLIFPDELDMNDTSVLKKIIANRTFEVWKKEKEIARLNALINLNIKETNIGNAFKFFVSVIREKL